MGIKGFMKGWIKEWMNGNKRIYEGMNKRMNKRIYERMNKKQLL